MPENLAGPNGLVGDKEAGGLKAGKDFVPWSRYP